MKEHVKHFKKGNLVLSFLEPSVFTPPDVILSMSLVYFLSGGEKGFLVLK